MIAVKTIIAPVAERLHCHRGQSVHPTASPVPPVAHPGPAVYNIDAAGEFGSMFGENSLFKPRAFLDGVTTLLVLDRGGEQFCGSAVSAGHKITLWLAAGCYREM